MVRGLVPLFGICSCRAVALAEADSLGVGPRVFIFRKRAVPAVDEIKDRHVKDEHGVVPGRAWSKDLAQSAPEIVFTWFGFHCLPKILDTVPFLTTKQWRGFSVPLSREDVSVAKSAGAC
jgi:hypothetical protein